jgi:hypothetical protein
MGLTKEMTGMNRARRRHLDVQRPATINTNPPSWGSGKKRKARPVVAAFEPWTT